MSVGGRTTRLLLAGLCQHPSRKTLTFAPAPGEAVVTPAIPTDTPNYLPWGWNVAPRDMPLVSSAVVCASGIRAPGAFSS